MHSEPHDTCFRAALDRMSDGFWMLDRDCRLIFLNRAALAVVAATNEPRETLAGRSVCELLPAAFFERFCDECRHALREAAPVSFTELCAPSDSQLELWLEVEISPGPEGLTVVMREATKSRDIGGALDVAKQRQAETELRAVLTNARCILWHADVWADPEYEAALAAGAEPWHNWRWRIRVQDEHAAQQVLPLEIPDGLDYTDRWAASRHSDDRTRINLAARHALMGGASDYAHEFRCFDKFGQTHWLHEETVIVPVAPGHWQLFGVATDVTERKIIEEKLREREEQLCFVTDHAAVYIAHCDEHERFLFVNEPYAARFGLRREQVEGRTIREVLGEAPYTAIAPQVALALRGNRTEFELEIPYASGSRWVWCIYVPESANADGAHRFVAVIQDITQRKIAEEKLRDSEARFRATFEQAAVGIALLDLDGSWLRVNQRLCNMVGYSHEELLTKTFGDITHPDDLEADWAQVRRLLAGEIESYQMEKRYIRKDGTTVWINLTAALRRRADGAPDYFISVIEDISARKKIETDLRDSEARFRRVSETISDYAYELRVLPGGALVPVWFTDALPKITGRSPEELHQPDSWRSFTHPDDLPLAEAHLSALLRGQADSSEFRIVGTDGSVRWLRDYAQPLLDENGTVIGIHGGAQDVTERKNAERAAHFLAAVSPTLGASLDYQTTLENLTQLCVAELGDLCLTYIEGESFALHVVRHTRPDKEELVRHFHERFPENEPPLAALRAGQAVLRATVSPEDWERVAQSPEHLKMLRSLQPHSIIMVPLLSENGFFGYITLAITESERRYDERDLRLAEEVARRASVAIERARLFRQMQVAREAAEAANRTKDEFLSVVSHELRTPLTPILGWVDIMRGPLDDNLKMHALEVLERNVRAQMQLVDDILDVSRITTGKLRLNMEPLDLSQVVTGAVDSVWLTATARNVKLFVAATDGKCLVHGDAGRLQQVVWNLLTNAIKFSSKEGTVEVELRREDAHAVIIVRDRGVGIAPDFLPHVFERFRQADSSHTRLHSGLGLGLSIVRHIAELHGGTVQAASEGKSLGATFTVRLPLLGDPATEPQA